MYGMKRTTVFLPEDLKADLERAAEAAACSEAELIRQGVREVTARHLAPEPDFPLFDSRGRLDASRVDEMLKGDPERGIPGFGED
jgi:Arc/MetJ-type ribon-helix-helix transcriptional regulator